LEIGPRLPLVDARGELARLLLLAEEAEDDAGEVGERVEVVDALEDAAIDDGWEGEDLGAVVPRELRDEGVGALEDVLEDGAAAEGAQHVDRDDEPVLDQAVVESLGV